MRFALIAAAFLLPSFAMAQSMLAVQGGAPQPLTLVVSPQNPSPGGTVTVTPQSTLINLADSTVTIYINGTQIYSGSAQPVAVTLGPSGSVTKIKAVALEGGSSFTATLALSPGSVSLVEEPLSYAPVLYAGKPLPGDGGSVRLVAVVDFRSSPTKPIPASALSYSWTVNGVALDNASGIGKSALVVDAPLEYRSENVVVSVESQDGSVTGGASVSITTDQPSMRIYADDPLQGILYDHALLGTATLTGSEGTFVAEPYSLSLAGGLPSIQWFLNGSAAQSGNTITLRPSGSGAGTASISVTSGTSATASLDLTYGSSGGSLLGL